MSRGQSIASSVQKLVVPPSHPPITLKKTTKSDKIHMQGLIFKEQQIWSDTSDISLNSSTLHHGILVKLHRGCTYTKKLFFTQKKSRLRKSENAKRLLYTKKTVTSHIKMRFLHPAEKVCRELAVGLNILDFPRPLPHPIPVKGCWCLRTADDVIRKACAQFASQRDHDQDKF